MELDERKEQLIERMLRQEADGLLSPGFRRNVLAQVNALPAPALLKPRGGARDLLYGVKLLTTGEKVALALALLSSVLVIIPPVSDLLTAWSWELSDMAVSVTVGDEVVSASLLSVLSMAGGTLFMVIAGAWGARQSTARA